MMVFMVWHDDTDGDDADDDNKSGAGYNEE